MPVDFVGREIEVRMSEGDSPAPVAFSLGEREFKVAEQLATWQDHAFAATGRGGRNWRQPQQRWFFRVRADDGEVYELYVDWSPGRRRRAARWYLHRHWTGAAEEKPAHQEPASG